MMMMMMMIIIIIIIIIIDEGFGEKCCLQRQGRRTSYFVMHVRTRQWTRRHILNIHYM